MTQIKNQMAVDKAPESLTEWADGFSQMMAEESMRLIEAQGNKRGGVKVARFLSMCFIAKFVGIMIVRTLTQKAEPKASKEETCKTTIAAFSDAKIKVQDAVAAGFQGAMTSFTGKSVEYYCQVKVVPEIANKRPI